MIYENIVKNCYKVYDITEYFVFYYYDLFIFFKTVNDQLITNACHDAALHILRNSGNHVTLLVKHYKAAAPFLLGGRGIYFIINLLYLFE